MARPALDKTTTTDSVVTDNKITKQETPFRHVYLVDIHDDGQLREVAIVKEEDNGTLYYIDIVSLDQVDKGRLKALVTNIHADKYALWDLMSQQSLSNGQNALDYFHQLVKVKTAPGTTNTKFGGGLSTVRAESNKIVGSESSNPSSTGVGIMGGAY